MQFSKAYYYQEIRCFLGGGKGELRILNGTIRAPSSSPSPFLMGEGTMPLPPETLCTTLTIDQIYRQLRWQRID